MGLANRARSDNNRVRAVAGMGTHTHARQRLGDNFQVESGIALFQVQAQNHPNEHRALFLACK